MLIMIFKTTSGNLEASSYDGFSGYMDYYDDLDDVAYAISDVAGSLRYVMLPELRDWLNAYQAGQEEEREHERLESMGSVFI